MRIDAYLVERGYATGRDKAKALLEAQAVSVNGKTVVKPSFSVEESDCVVCSAPLPRYVGRGGLKLEKALSLWDGTLQGAECMDVGASTGGFTDCMLQNGAVHVTAVDVGHGQLHQKLREDSRVTVMEGTDIRSPALRNAVLPGSLDFVAVDVSFISLDKILPYLSVYLKESATAVCLIKPQFEAGASALGKRGVVKDPKVHERVLNRCLALFQEEKFIVKALTFSPITGGEGNIEYLAVLQRGNGLSAVSPAEVTPLVKEAQRVLKGGKSE